MKLIVAWIILGVVISLLAFAFGCFANYHIRNWRSWLVPETDTISLVIVIFIVLAIAWALKTVGFPF